MCMKKGTYPSTPGMSLKKQVVSPLRKDRICFPKGSSPFVPEPKRRLTAETHGRRHKSSGVRQLAAAFSPASLLAFHRSECRAPVRGQQAGPAEREKRQQAAALQSTWMRKWSWLVYCGSAIFGHGGGLLWGIFHSSSRRVHRGFAYDSSSPDLVSESGGLRRQVESEYFGPRAGQAAETIRCQCPGGLRHQ